MPLFVVGSWDIQIPTEILPEMEAPKPYYQSFGIKNLLPNWGLGIGSFISSTVILILIILVVLYLSPGLLARIFKLK